MRSALIATWVLSACASSPTGGATPSSSPTPGGPGSSSPGTPPVAPVVPPTLFVWGGPDGGIAVEYFGAGLAFATGAAGEDELVVAAPSATCVEVCEGPKIYVHGDPLAEPGPYAYDFDTIAYGDAYLEPAFGRGLSSPGDVTGDGIADLVAFDVPADGPSTEDRAFLLPGPVEDRGSLTAEGDFLSLVSPSGIRSAPCGDLSGDGIAELCTNEGIYQAPVGGGDAPVTTWSAASPSLDVLVASSGHGDLLLWDPADAMVHRLAAFPAGDLDPEAAPVASWAAPAGGAATALATGDLDGDGSDDVALAWTDGSAAFVWLATDASGGDLGAGTVLPLPAAALAIADFDGDGSNDLAVGGASEVRIFRGPFFPGDLAPEEALAWWVGDEYPTDHFGDALLPADLDHDGRSDLVIGAPEHGQASVNPLQMAMGRVYGAKGL